MYLESREQKETSFAIGHFRVPLRFCFKASLSAKQSYENDLDLHENETACRTHFHMKGFALRLVLKQRHYRTRQWPVARETLLHPIKRHRDEDERFPPRVRFAKLYFQNKLLNRRKDNHTYKIIIIEYGHVK